MKKTKKQKKFTLSNLVWIGFNYTCGMAFPLAFSSLITSKQGIGLWVFLIILCGSFLAAIMGYGYAKLSKYFTRSNGATYTFVRGTFGRFWGFFIGLLQYFVMPLVVASMILSMISVNFIPIIGKAGWGKYTSVYLNLIGIGIFAIFASCIFFGLKYFKIFINISGIIKWSASIIIIVFVLGLACLANFGGFSLLKNPNIGKNTNFFTLNSAFVTFFYFYGGFETYSTITKNVKDPSRTIPKAIMWITFLTFTFYVVVLTLFVGALPIIGGPNGVFSKNPVFDIGFKAAKTVGIIIVLASMISLKINAAIQSGLFATTMLEPLAIESYITPKLSYLTPEKISKKAVSINIIVTILATFMLAIFPVLVIGGNGKNVDYAEIIGLNSAILLTQYFLASLCILKLYFKKKILLKWWELLMFGFISMFIAMELIIFFVNAGRNIALINNPASEMSSIFSIIELIILFGFVSATIIIYVAYYLPVYKKRLQINPQLQKKLDHIFKISKLADLERNTFYDFTNLKQELKEQYLKARKTICIKHTPKEIKANLKHQTKIVNEQLAHNIKKHKKEIVNIYSCAQKTDDWTKINLNISIINKKIEALKIAKTKRLIAIKEELDLLHKLKKDYKARILLEKKKRYRIIANYINNYESKIEYIN